MRLPYLLSMLLMITACTAEIQPISTNHSFFNLAQFLSDYVADSVLVDVTKTTEINGLRETREIEHYPLFEDLSAFANYDIDRPALLDKYIVDSTWESSRLTVHYQSIDSSLKVRSMRITQIPADEVQQIEINAVSRSFLEDAAVSILIKPSSGYSLKRISHKIFQDPRQQVVDVKIGE